MKTSTKCVILMFAIVSLCGTLSAQKKKKDEPVPEKPDAGRFRWEQSKVIPKLKKLAITELTVNYKLTTTAKTITQESRSGGQIAGARVTGFLEFTDSQPSPADFQGITDHFYHYFQKKLKENGIDTVGWNDVTASEFYTKIDAADEKDDAAKEGGGNKWVTYTANNGKIVKKGLTGFAGGKGKRAMEYAKEFGTAASFKVNVDFADVMVNLEVKSTDQRDIGNGYYYPATSSKKFTWGVHAQMMVGDQENKDVTFLWGAKAAEFLWQWSDIPTVDNYATSVSEDVSRARSGLAKQFAFSKELTPVVIETTREKYIDAAKRAVDEWVDAWVTRAVQMRKN
jgi:hypothetical protein